MTIEERCLEENVALLIRAASGPPARPSTQAGKQAFCLMLGHLRARSAPVAFPDGALAILGTTLALVAIWLTARSAVISTSLAADVSLLVMVVWLFLNLTLIPVAGIVILARRRYG